MANEVKILVTGQNKFSSTQAEISKELARLRGETNTVSSGIKHYENRLDAVGAKAKAQVNDIAGLSKEYKGLGAAVGSAGRSLDKLSGDVGKAAKKTGDGIRDGAGNAAAEVVEKVEGAASGLLSAGMKAAKSFVGGISDGVGKAGPYIQAALIAVAVTAAAVVGPMVGGALAGGVVVGFGAGVAGIGVVAAAQTGRVKSSFANLWQFVVDGAKSAAQPLEQVLVNFAGRAKTILGGGLGASGRSFLGSIAPDLDAFGDSLLRAVAKFEPALEPLSRAFGRVLGDLGPTLERTLAGISDALIDVSESVARNPEALGDFIEMTGDLVETGLDAVSMLNLWWDTNKRLVDIATTPFEWIGLKDGEEAAIAAKGALAEVAETSWSARSPAQQLEESWKALAEAGGDVAKRGDEMARMLDILAGRTPSFEEAQQRINDSIRGLEETFGDAANWVDGYGSALIKADGTVNTASANGSMLYDTIQELKTGFTDSAAAVRELENAGWAHDDAVNKVNADMQTQYDRLLSSAGQMGLTRSEMQKLLDTYGLTPRFLDTIARLDENGVRAKLDMLAYTRTVIFRGVLDASQLPNGATYKMGEYGGYAHGGVSGGGWTTVGELGPERVKLPPGAQVQPYTESRRQLEPAGVGTGSTGGGSITFNLAGLPPAGTSRQFLDWFFEQCRNSGVRLVTA